MQDTLTQEQHTTQNSAPSCHGGPQMDTSGLPLVVIVGSPNVGKSVLFNTLTGLYVTVSNYPGTTVEVTRGKGHLNGLETGVMDTPGMYGLLPITEEERVARQILLREQPDLVLHVLDAKNIERMLPMTLQLIEAGLPVILVVNLLDEADQLGVKVNISLLREKLGIPVIGTALAYGRGAQELKELIAGQLSLGRRSCCALPDLPPELVHYPPAIQDSLKKIESLLSGTYSLSHRSIALLLLERDAEVTAMVKAQEKDQARLIMEAADVAVGKAGQPLTFQIARAQRDAAQRWLGPILALPERKPSSFASRLSEAMIGPLTGLPILILALFLLYEFVGVLGAQTLVQLLEVNLFGQYINPLVDRFLAWLIPWQILRDLFGGQFGVITLGVRYAVAIVLPIVGTFFLAFSVIEDSGYLPRLALLIDRVFKRIGLNGRAVIPLVLGFGCDTMATLVTRTLETKRERLLATILLSLAIPCSAQLGVMLALLNGHLDLLVIWLSILAGIFLLVGYLTARLMPGERPSFYMELPPLRLPRLRNILVKTYTRMEWYLREVFPLFIIASVIIWFGRLTGLFELAVQALVPMVHLIGLPDQTAQAFLFGFFRRDYGAAGLYDMRSLMTPVQLVVATVTMTLFIPCIAQFSVTAKERGWKTAVAIAAFIFPFSLIVGGLLNLVLTSLRLPL
ncbi:MAG: ferrous iron transport protein B [Omnitrophica WOR_2 bacterium]